MHRRTIGHSSFWTGLKVLALNAEWCQTTNMREYRLLQSPQACILLTRQVSPWDADTDR